MQTKEEVELDKIDFLQKKIRKSRLALEIHQEDLTRSIADLKRMGIKITEGDRVLSRIERELRRLDKKEAELTARLEEKMLKIERRFQ